ncbi:MAG: hypothetical protein H6673_04215 [Anaerolineales bacterium]|nr:hypothetical protein [Anaerolineales bacterium]
MSNSPQPPQLLTAKTLTKANLLGGVLFILLILTATGLYFLLGLIGWDAGSAGRILVALVVSPLVVGIGFALVWMLMLKKTNG